MSTHPLTGWSLFIAWITALISTLSVLFIGEVMGQAPCVLCWYQRICMFPLAFILGLAVFREDRKIWLYTLPLAVVGALIAAYHTLLMWGIVPKPITPCAETGPSCSGAEMMILGVPIPFLSFLAFTLIAITLYLSRKEN